MADPADTKSGYRIVALADSAVAHLRGLVQASSRRGGGIALLDALAG